MSGFLIGLSVSSIVLGAVNLYSIYRRRRRSTERQTPKVTITYEDADGTRFVVPELPVDRLDEIPGLIREKTDETRHAGLPTETARTRPVDSKRREERSDRPKA
jgi:hypothetical protein